MTEFDGVSAAMRYKEIVGRARESAEKLRAWELARAEELDTTLADATQAVAAAIEREQGAAERAIRWWKMTVHNVEHLAWLDVGDDPEPTETARASYLGRYLEEIKPSYSAFVQAVLSLGWRARR